MSGQAAALGWLGLATGIAGLGVYVLVVLRQPELVRMLNGSGLMLTSLALVQARQMIGLAGGPSAFNIQASVLLLILAVIAQAASALRNRRAWDGMERRRPDVGMWDGAGVRARAEEEAGTRSRPLGEERA